MYYLTYVGGEIENYKKYRKILREAEDYRPTIKTEINEVSL